MPIRRLFDTPFSQGRGEDGKRQWHGQVYAHTNLIEAIAYYHPKQKWPLPMQYRLKCQHFFPPSSPSPPQELFQMHGPVGWFYLSKTTHLPSPASPPHKIATGADTWNHFPPTNAAAVMATSQGSPPSGIPPPPPPPAPGTLPLAPPSPTSPISQSL